MTSARATTDPDPGTTARTRAKRGAILVYETLRDDILWLNIAPGAVVDEVALAARFAISRTPIREALMLLAGDGLVVFQPNRTSIVRPLSLHNMGEYMDMYLLLSRSVVHGAVRNPATARDARLRDGLADLLLALETAPGIPALRAELDLRHRLGDAAGNAFQNGFYRQILDMGIRSRILHYFPNATAADLATARQDWISLLDAIASGDAAAADRITTRMILAEVDVTLRSLHPAFGHRLSLSPEPPTGEP